MGYSTKGADIFKGRSLGGVTTVGAVDGSPVQRSELVHKFKAARSLTQRMVLVVRQVSADSGPAKFGRKKQ